MNKLLHTVLLLTTASFVAAHSDEASHTTDASHQVVSIRYMIDDVPAAVKFYTTHLGFTLEFDGGSAFASVTRNGVRLLLGGKASSSRRAMPDGRQPIPGGWNRIQIEVDDIESHLDWHERQGFLPTRVGVSEG